MAQILKEEMRARLVAAALEVFGKKGFQGASLAEIAKRAGTATANVYRYYPNKEALLDGAIPPELVREHWRRLEASVASLSHLTDPDREPAGSPEGEALLNFWIEHRLAVAFLLDRAEGSRHAGVGVRFVKRLLALTIAELERADPEVELSATDRWILQQIFEGTRRTLAEILGRFDDAAEIRAAVGAFRLYQRAGLQNFARGLSRRRAQ